VNLYALFALRKGEDIPELLEAWDEYSVDGNWDGWEAARTKALASIGDELHSSAIITITVPVEPIEQALNPRVEVTGEVTTP
jgi:hypothetical protein